MMMVMAVVRLPACNRLEAGILNAFHRIRELAHHVPQAGAHLHFVRILLRTLERALHGFEAALEIAGRGALVHGTVELPGGARELAERGKELPLSTRWWMVLVHVSQIVAELVLHPGSKVIQRAGMSHDGGEFMRGGNRTAAKKEACDKERGEHLFFHVG